MSGSDADDGEDTGLHDEEDNYMEHHQLGDMFQEVLTYQTSTQEETFRLRMQLAQVQVVIH